MGRRSSVGIRFGSVRCIYTLILGIITESGVLTLQFQHLNYRVAGLTNLAIPLTPVRPSADRSPLLARLNASLALTDSTAANRCYHIPTHTNRNANLYNCDLHGRVVGSPFPAASRTAAQWVKSRTTERVVVAERLKLFLLQLFRLLRC